MTTSNLKGRIRDTGQVKEWTAGELDEALRVVPMTGTEIVEAGLLGGWADEGIKDGQVWVEELRERRRRLNERIEEGLSELDRGAGSPGEEAFQALREKNLEPASAPRKPWQGSEQKSRHPVPRQFKVPE
jgi:hypothetical protein